MRLAAVQATATLSALFLVVYGTCNWITAHRAGVGTWYFAWERQIPFVPAMIIPYMSIDLFFVGAPFLCRDRTELSVFTRRVTVAILVAGACFLTLPLRFAFERPAVAGWLGDVFNTFRSLDPPFNLFPSLHITLRTLLAELYARHTNGFWRGAAHVWFSLIGLSTVLTYQHHVVDVAGGFVLATVCLYLVRDSAPRLPVARNPRVGAYYAVGSAASAGLALATWPWGGLLLWPAVALGTVAGGYFGLGPGIFRKADGRLALSARLLLGPCLAGQWLSLAYYRRQGHPWDDAAPGVLIGGRLTTGDAAAAIGRGVTAVLDLTAEFSEARPFRALAYRNVQILDLTAPTPAQLDEAVRFITEQAPRGTVYVHCKIGYSRSAAVVGAYLLASGRARTADEAVAILRRARPAIVVRPEAYGALRAFAMAGAG
jgi:membrane-associated phospholipid phosphatase